MDCPHSLRSWSGGCMCVLCFLCSQICLPAALKKEIQQRSAICACHCRGTGAPLASRSPFARTHALVTWQKHVHRMWETHFRESCLLLFAFLPQRYLISTFPPPGYRLANKHLTTCQQGPHLGLPESHSRQFIAGSMDLFSSTETNWW